MSGVPSWAVRGRKIVCIATSTGGRDPRGYVAFPTRGNIYTVREVRCLDVPAVLLEEIVNPVIVTTHGAVERGFILSRFRPLVTIEDDIEAHFANLLRVPTNQPVDA